MDNIINSDIYKITELVNDIKNKYIEDETEETLAMGIYGYFGEVCSAQLQNAIIVASELGNEVFSTRAKMEKNIITHAIIQNITDINAVPAKMTIMLGMLESELVEHLVGGSFIIDKECKIFIEDFEYHLDYDLHISQSILSGNTNIYTAQYNIYEKNVLSDINNPYLTPPIKINIENETYIFINCLIRQVELTKLYKKIITSNAINNKTFDFEFESQLATFDVYVTERGSTKRIIPVFEGGIIDSSIAYYCYFNYIDSNMIRVKFDRNSYEPSIGAEIEIRIQTTQGKTGSFIYKDDVFINIESEKYGYRNINLLLKPLTDSINGKDRKSAEELKRIFPKEALSRGNITNTKDLNNFFNIINTENSRTLFLPKVNNQIERVYYMYLLLKDNNSVIVPTNTIDIVLKESDFAVVENDRYVFNPGTYISYDGSIGSILKNPTPEQIANAPFLYSIPFMAVINYSPLYSSYYLNIMDKKLYLKFEYINQNSELQFISTYINWTRGFLVNKNNYKMKIECVQNINADKGLIVKNPTTKEIITDNTKMIALLYNEDIPYRYSVGELKSYDEASFIYGYEFNFKTNDIINSDNYIRIEDVYLLNSTIKDYGYFKNNIKIKVYMLGKFDEEFGRHDLDRYVPDLDGYSVCNVYEVIDGVNFFYNYSHIISSRVTPLTIDDNGSQVNGFKLTSVPVVKYSYCDNDEKIQKFIDQLEDKKEYINDALLVLENSFGIDFKLFNTYGPSRTFMVNSNTKLNRINITLHFKLKVLANSDKYTRDYIINDIKSIIEDLNELVDLHIPNLITDITTKYRKSIEYFEFVGINEFGPGIQHLYQVQPDEISIIPEFININTKDDGITPDINITLV